MGRKCPPLIKKRIEHVLRLEGHHDIVDIVRWCSSHAEELESTRTDSRAIWGAAALALSTSRSGDVA